MERMKAERLRTEYLDNPLGIGTTAPRLGWIVKSDRRGAAQSAYRIVAAVSPEALERLTGDGQDGGGYGGDGRDGGESGDGLLWDSGVVGGEAGSNAQHVVFGGGPLGSGDRVCWRVRVWDERGEPGEWSEPAYWSVGLLSRSDWEGHWVGRPSGRKPTKEKPLPAVYLRRAFRARGGVRRATVYATALGLYRLYLNGVPVGDRLFAPEWTDYHVRVQYQTYDVTGLLRGGDNAVAAVLGHGWYTGYIGMYGYQKYGMDPSLLLQLNIEYEDGSSQSVATDDGWRASFGPIVATDLQMGESYDARLEQLAWDTAAFDDGGWEPAKRMYDYRGRLVPQLSPPIRAVEVRKPTQVRAIGGGRTLVDMGQITSGFLRTTFRGLAGTTFTLRYGEALDANGELYVDNLRYARQTDTYICRGRGRETFEPAFTYHGYRYVEISGDGPGLIEDEIEGIVVHSDLPETGRLETSHPLVNRLLANIRWTQRANYMSVPTDCPQRDERHGWTGDAQIFAPTAAYNMDVAAFLAKWLTDLDDGQRPTGTYTDFAPFIFGPKTEFDNDFTYTHTASAGWADAPPIIAWLLYERYGDLGVLEAHYDALKRWMAYNEALYPGGIRRDAPQYGDWLSIDERPGEETKREFGWLVAGHSTTPYDVFSTAYWVRGTRLMADIAGALGREADAAHYAALHESVRDAFIREFVGADGAIKGDTQTVYALALSWRLVPDEMRPGTLRRLVAKLEAAGEAWSGGGGAGESAGGAGGGQGGESAGGVGGASAGDSGERTGSADGEPSRRGDGVGAVAAATGFHGTKHLMEALSANGREDLAFRLLLREEYPSWLYSVRQGATTIWERWDGWTEEKGFQDPGMNSLCHYAFGSVGEWLYRHVGGIGQDAAAPGFARAIVRPRPLGGLTGAACAYDSIRGLYRTAWTLREGSAFELEVEVPANGGAIVHVPADAGTAVTEGGVPAGEAEGVEALGREGDCETFRIGAGTYRFASTYEGGTRA